MVIWSEQARKIILIELTVPWEEGCEEAHDLVQECKNKGWQAWLFPVEVGCRGFPAQSVWKMLTVLGIAGKEGRTSARRLGKLAE